MYTSINRILGQTLPLFSVSLQYKKKEASMRQYLNTLFTLTMVLNVNAQRRIQGREGDGPAQPPPTHSQIIEERPGTS